MSSLNTIMTFAKTGIKQSLRDKVAIFFIFVFPLIFLFIFGGLFGGDSDASYRVALLNNSKASFANSFVENLKKDKTFEVSDPMSEAAALAKIKQGELDAIIKFPQNFGKISSNKPPTPAGEAEIIYDQSSAATGVTLTTIMQGIMLGVNSETTGVSPPFTVKATSTAEPGAKRFDYTFAGMLGFSILGLGIFGPIQYFPRMKTKGILRRYRTTTIRVWEFFVSSVLSQMFIGVMSTALMIVVANLVFDLNMQGSYLLLTLVAILGIATLFGIGLAIGGWAKNENQAAPLGNLISFPLMFLSGTFFPRYLMPDWLQNVSEVLPLTPINEATTKIVTEGAGLVEIAPQLGLMGAWMVVIYFIAFKVFRWE